ncbi:hypothetical protein GCM10027577_32680 [Spirosoma fluminis]
MFIWTGRFAKASGTRFYQQLLALNPAKQVQISRLIGLRGVYGLRILLPFLRTQQATPGFVYYKDIYGYFIT